MSTEVCLTFDVEERFHSHLSVPGAPRTWSAGGTLSRLVDWLEEHQKRATFFVVGEVAEQYPSLVRRIAKAGFEVASHTHTHLRMDGARAQECAADIARGKAVLEDLTGLPVRGFRAPSWTAQRTDRWLWDHLLELGFTYDSSLFPFKTPMYGSFRNPVSAFRLSGGLLEIPPSAVARGPLRLPFGGGFYFRAAPLGVTRAMIRDTARAGRTPVLYFHPWELEPTDEAIDDGRFKAFIANFRTGDAGAHFKTLVSGYSTTTMLELANRGAA